MATLALCDVHTPSILNGDRVVGDAQSLTDRITRAVEARFAKDVTPVTPGKSEPNNKIGDDFDVLVTAAVDGERDAVESVLRRIRPFVMRYCRARVGNQEKTFASADDIAQEVCLAVLKALPSYRNQGRPFLAFVYGIAGHKVADACRSAARNRAEPVSEIPDVWELADSPEMQVMHGESAQRMAELLDTLPNRQRDILVMRIVEGFSVEKTAAAVGTTPGAVRVAQHRALNRLRTLLESKSCSDLGVSARVSA